MSDWLALLIVTLLATLLFLSLREFRKTQAENAKVSLAQLATLSKMAALLAAKDVLAFQAIQAMDTYEPAEVESPVSSYPSEEELDLLLNRHNAGEELTEEEYERIERGTVGEFRDPSDFR